MDTLTTSQTHTCMKQGRSPGPPKVPILQLPQSSQYAGVNSFTVIHWKRVGGAGRSDSQPGMTGAQRWDLEQTSISQNGSWVLTQHALGDGEGECGPPGHPPTGREVGQFCPQHVHNHLVIQGQVEMVLVDEL